jgi:hypothetical protein
MNCQQSLKMLVADSALQGQQLPGFVVQPRSGKALRDQTKLSLDLARMRVLHILRCSLDRLRK